MLTSFQNLRGLYLHHIVNLKLLLRFSSYSDLRKIYISHSKNRRQANF